MGPFPLQQVSSFSSIVFYLFKCWLSNMQSMFSTPLKTASKRLWGPISGCKCRITWASDQGKMVEVSTFSSLSLSVQIVSGFAELCALELSKITRELLWKQFLDPLWCACCPPPLPSHVTLACWPPLSPLLLHLLSPVVIIPRTEGKACWGRVPLSVLCFGMN